MTCFNYLSDAGCLPHTPGWFIPKLSAIIQNREGNDLQFFIIERDIEDIDIDMILYLLEDKVQNALQALQIRNRTTNAVYHRQLVGAQLRLFCKLLPDCNFMCQQFATPEKRCLTILFHFTALDDDNRQDDHS